MEFKKCNVCGEEKPLDCFEQNRAKCRECFTHMRKIWRAENKHIISENGKKYYEEHKEEILEKQKIYSETNKDKIKERHKKYKPNREKYYEEHKEKIKQDMRNYYIKNKEVIKAKKNEYEKLKRNEDPAFRIRKLMSRAINSVIKQNGGSKNGVSCLIKLGVDYPLRLRNHLESLFESWMNWENQGTYNLETWDDNDPATWVWNIDHIIPHSYFKYISPEDIECQKAWALSNLRPLSAKENVAKKDFIDDITLKIIMKKIEAEISEVSNNQ